MRIKGIKKPVVTKELATELRGELQELRKTTQELVRKFEGLPDSSKRKRARKS